MSTPHNQANVGDIAKTVLMPGDPLRAKFIAETYLEDVVQFNTVRNMFGFTGTYKNKKISVMGSGMGMPSIGIYSYELFSKYGVENIIRIGSAGSYVEECKLYDVVLSTGAFSESTYAIVSNDDHDPIQKPSEELNAKLREAAKELNIPLQEGVIHSCDVFYTEPNVQEEYWKRVHENKLLAVEMESFALFHNAKVLGKNAACMLTISDSFVTNEKATTEERQVAFNDMMKIALEAAIK